MADLLDCYNLEQLRWRSLYTRNDYIHPNGRNRRLGGVEHVEDIFNRHLKGDQTLFFGLTIDLHDPVNIAKLDSSAQECWCWLRFQVPTIASSIIGSDDKLPTMTYMTASPEEISQWA
ncbi:hypothetical protein CY34DRAFT_16502 [Suillus luteus UH-Slu-Lm8-n1]|uniref:Uncharacterized protein n=1 Tax=Suillus luteus UH-Slu-Lm8-n1 TaxID=930992 RepID=A0A0D0AWJ3_9AGAM|nr:hypothetical protein CY34DRAFT_16502 [Suillus luteus UH-Slu-Lm8-n1]